MEYKEVYESWLANPYFDEATKQELLSIKDDENEIKERFYADLEFGTAGLRGIIGAGTNRMNVYVVRKTTQGLANYISKQNAADKGVAIAFDQRRNYLLQSDILAVQPVSISQPATIRRNTTVTRFIGQMVHRSHRRMIQELWQR